MTEEQKNEENSSQQNHSENNENEMMKNQKMDSTDEIIIFDNEDKTDLSEGTEELNTERNSEDSQESPKDALEIAAEIESFREIDLNELQPEDSDEKIIKNWDADSESLEIIESIEEELKNESGVLDKRTKHNETFESGEYLKLILDEEIKIQENVKKERKIVFTESFGYACQVCNAQVSMKCKCCKNCGVEFAYILCENCNWTGEPDDFRNHVCPNCGISPVKIPKEFSDKRKCSNCKQLLRNGQFACHYCNWIDIGSLIWFFAFIAFLLIFAPLFSKNIAGFAGNIIYWTGLILGGFLLWNFGQTLLDVLNKPKRFGFYWFLTIIAVSLLLL